MKIIINLKIYYLFHIIITNIYDYYVL